MKNNKNIFCFTSRFPFERHGLIMDLLGSMTSRYRNKVCALICYLLLSETRVKTIIYEAQINITTTKMRLYVMEIAVSGHRLCKYIHGVV